MTGTECDLVVLQQANRGTLFFSDLLYTVSHQYFAPEIAETLWKAILYHKCLISSQLGRNVRITVAALDYLSNVTSELSSPTLISEAYVSEIANLAMRDSMTGLFNHTTCYEFLELEFRSNRRFGLGLSLLLLDIDNFKSVNDNTSHQAGDRVLVELAKTLVHEARDSDVCCRLGGDEFVVILRQTKDPDEALAIAERIRGRVMSAEIAGERIAVSIGIAVCNLAVTSASALIEKGDLALHQAKAEGKNCVVLAR